MYRRKDRIKQKPSDTKFWQKAANLKKWRFQNSVHALAFFNRQAYNFIIQSLHDKVSLELIMSGLWKYHKQALLTMQDQGLGTLSPNSLLTFKTRFFDRGIMIDIDTDLELRKQEIEEMKKSRVKLDQKIDQLKVIHKKLDMPTRIGVELINQSFYLNKAILDLQIQLGMADR